jgi:predicted enzyme related to lactoylglutathione lyase
VAAAADVDATAERIKGAGGKLLNEPEDRPWGARMFQFKDPDGFFEGAHPTALSISRIHSSS